MCIIIPYLECIIYTIYGVGSSHVYYYTVFGVYNIYYIWCVLIYRNSHNFRLINFRVKNVSVKHFRMKKLNENYFTRYIIIHAIYNYTRDI